MFRYSFSETIPIFSIRLSANIVNVLHSKDAKNCMVRINLEKLAYHQNSESCILAEIFDRFVGNVCREISRCYSESILMKVSDITMHIIEIT